MSRWIGLAFLLCAFVLPSGRCEEPANQQLVNSWSKFEANFISRTKEKVNPGSHSSGTKFDVISGDVVRSPSLRHPILGVLEVQVLFYEDSSVRTELPNGFRTRTLQRIVSYQLRFAPADGEWTFADGVGTLVWSTDEDHDHPGEKVKLELNPTTSRLGEDLVAQLLQDKKK